MLREKDAMKGEMNRKGDNGSEEFTDKVTKGYNVEAAINLKGRLKEREE